MELRVFSIVAVMSFGLLCAAPASAGFLGAKLTDSDPGIASIRDSSDFQPEPDPQNKDVDWLPALGRIGFATSWPVMGYCTDDKCTSDFKGANLAPITQAVPEPGTLMLFGVALGVLGFVIRRCGA